MEVELFTEGLPEDEYYNIDDINEDYSNFEGERCGICMDIVIDRGVLDCCQHWFCFTCIDNWATITNLCPLCQNEFQLITCVPVYDSIGNNKTDEDLPSRDEDWCIDGKNNTLSFPSYYIDEDAVACLDGDGCKFRTGSVAVEEDANVDTSIACDSCDKWYHAFCVGFDTESTCEDSWLCPRCLVKETPERSNGIPVYRSKQIGLENVSHECIAGNALARKVSVSVADVGETAVVISMFQGDQVSQESSGQFPALEFGKDLKVDASLSNTITNAPKLETVLHKGSDMELKLGTQALELSLSGNTFFPSSSHSIVPPDLISSNDEKRAGELRLLDGLGGSSSHLSATPTNDKFLESGLDLHLGLSVGSSSAVDLVNNEGAKNQMPGIVLQKYDSGEKLSPAQKVGDDKKEMLCTKRIASDNRENGVAGAKRKHSDNRDVDGRESKAKTEAKYSLKKVKAEGKSKHIQSKDQPDESQSGSLPKKSNSVTVSKDEIVRSSSKKENVTDIMDIVQETRKPLRQLARSDPADMLSNEIENASGVRVKKIMRRASNDKDTSLAVQRLRKEIREAVRNKSSKELGENLFDPKLLAAFRAVVAGQTTESKSISVDPKAKKSLLQKGKVREHLTKKIYGVGGKRRRAWTRDCEIEFWKYRCSKVSKPEKVKTLKSVLDLLRYDSDNKTAECEKEREAPNTFLSRLYLADTSVFPRKDDIRPASTHEDAADQEQNKENRSTERSSSPSSSHASDTSVKTNDSLVNRVNPPLDTKATKKSIPNMTCKTTSSTSPPNKCPKAPSVSASDATKGTAQKKSVDNIKTDKRKWALELLARKTAVVGKKEEKEEDNAMPKGNYPLLAQLPKDMLPELAPIRHNKVPASVRQTQLYRLSEHLLKKANLPVIRRTAETELAIVDAINIEKEIADRSNSKPVYVNLCSQELLRRAETNSTKVAEANASTSEIICDKAEAGADSCAELGVDEALKAAGLLPDSPPGSPHEAVDEIKEDGGASEMKEEDGPDNIFEVGSHPELDIYGDFEYNLEDDDFIGASALKLSKPQPEGSKIKVVLSTLNNPDKLDGTPDILDNEKSATVEVPEGSCGLPNCRTSHGGSTVDVSTDNCLSQSSTLDVGEELSLAECEELYGPDKEPLVKKYPETASVKPCEPLVNDENPGEMVDHASRNMEKVPNNESNTENLEKAAALPAPISENSSRHSQKSENATVKEKRLKSETTKSDSYNSVSKKVEGYIKEHIRPLCKSGVITVEQYRWAVGKTTEKVMKYHSKDKNANFLIKEGEKVKKLAEQYVEGAQQTTKDH